MYSQQEQIYRCAGPDTELVGDTKAEGPLCTFAHQIHYLSTRLQSREVQSYKVRDEFAQWLFAVFPAVGVCVNTARQSSYIRRYRSYSRPG